MRSRTGGRGACRDSIPLRPIRQAVVISECGLRERTCRASATMLPGLSRRHSYAPPADSDILEVSS